MAELKNLIVTGSAKVNGTVFTDKVTGLNLPVQNSDAANKEYVDGKVAPILTAKNTIITSLSTWNLGITNNSSLSEISTALSGIAKRTTITASGRVVTALSGYYPNTVTTTISGVSVYSGSDIPANSFGNNGDIYIRY